MRGTVAKRLRREHKAQRMTAKATSYFIGENGMIISDRDRRIYQMRKERYYDKSNTPLG